MQTTTMQTMAHTVSVLHITNQTVKFIHNGHETSTTGLTASADPGSLRASAANEMKRANEAVRRAALMIATAETKEIQAFHETERKAKQRRERAAATRAHNADPFGFKAAGYS